MTPTRPMATNDDIEESCVSPTSEVGSVQAQNADRWIEANDGLRALFEAQQNNMRLLVEALRNPPAI
ncbi:unnamed protein product [Parnassius apollo]|uniref:(apollo) hypothetical protein n=1 Tax=Parnassius apollo TaxID=110799 RepID=A0A8S3YFP7_PARAO|nr:unnamed protein product [Parnassius apollo]